MKKRLPKKSKQAANAPSFDGDVININRGREAGYNSDNSLVDFPSKAEDGKAPSFIPMTIKNATGKNERKAQSALSMSLQMGCTRRGESCC